jgi:hypothetical protein
MLTTTIDKIKKLEITSINNILCNNFSNTKLKNKQTFNCKICNKIFTNNRALSNHNRICKNNIEVLEVSNENNIIEIKEENNVSSENNKSKKNKKSDKIEVVM